MAKKKFEQSEMKVIMLESNDCIQTSGGDCSLVYDICEADSECGNEVNNSIWDR